ncbi:STAS/SEC14 domain-containing protein [Qipengyuania sp.]|uniref:STAS/SEC14 domain-containing protein n=1 Tax=Qipengyuania sp. TaxID=2004515 RepID=UPI003AF681C2
MRAWRISSRGQSEVQDTTDRATRRRPDCARLRRENLTQVNDADAAPVHHAPQPREEPDHDRHRPIARGIRPPPRPQGALAKADFDRLAETIDTRINETDRVPNLVICLDGLPHWDSLGALTRHFHFVKEHQKIVKKVAVVGDAALLALAPRSPTISSWRRSAASRRASSRMPRPGRGRARTIPGASR